MIELANNYVLVLYKQSQHCLEHAVIFKYESLLLAYVNKASPNDKSSK